MIVLTICLIIAVPIIKDINSIAFVFTVFLPCIFISLFIKKIKDIFIEESSAIKKIVICFIFILLSYLFLYYPIKHMLIPYLSYTEIDLSLYIIGIICIIVMLICKKHMKKRTPYGMEMIGKIRGFRNFLITVDKDKLESMVNENPYYFFDILPYTYVLGISNKWIKKFEKISIKSPEWYDNDDSHEHFNTHSFGSFMNSTMNSARSAMTTGSSSSSSSGGSSGGGSSGGGSGGGGGGSW